MARELISSRGTFFFKFILPALFTASVVSGFGESQPALARLPAGKWIFLAVGVCSCAYLWLISFRLEKVWIDGENFVMSNYRREDLLPLRTVTRVSGSGNFIKIAVDGGESFLLLPPLQSLPLGREHPMADRLRRLIAERTRKEIDQGH